MKTSAKYIIVADWETGGLPNSKQKAFFDVPAVEWAMSCIDLEKLEIIDRYSAILPYNYKEDLIGYSEEVTAVHGITKEMQEANSVPLKEIYKTLKSWFSKYKNPRQLCTIAGHNFVTFDKPFLENFFIYMNDDINNYVRFWLDTMQLAHLSALEQIDFKLGTCCQLAGVDLVEAHRAQNDVDANALLLISYIKKLRGEGQTQLSNKKKIRFRNTFELQ